ncbi:transposase [Streptomyces zaomyceticus]|uniref:transposase n=1 Tax=Streptomyces zaomyceticus TaxID=68286 RepID=UPI0036833814
MREFIDASSDRLTVFQLPTCAPDLNPTEGVWSLVKRDIGNLAAADLGQMSATRPADCFRRASQVSTRGCRCTVPLASCASAGGRPAGCRVPDAGAVPASGKGLRRGRPRRRRSSCGIRRCSAADGGPRARPGT